MIGNILLFKINLIAYLNSLIKLTKNNLIIFYFCPYFGARVTLFAQKFGSSDPSVSCSAGVRKSFSLLRPP